MPDKPLFDRICRAAEPSWPKPSPVSTGPDNELWDRVYWRVALEVDHAVSYRVGDTFADEPAQIVR